MVTSVSSDVDVVMMNHVIKSPALVITGVPSDSGVPDVS